MKNKYIVICLFFISGLMQAQDKTTWVDSIPDYFNQQLSVFPQEKIYVHLDRYFYHPDNTISFKLYLIDAATHILLDRADYFQN